MMTNKTIIKRIELINSLLFNLRIELSDLDDSVLKIKDELSSLQDDIKKSSD